MRKPTVRQLARKMGLSNKELLAKLKSMGSNVKSADDFVDVNPLEAGVARSYFWPVFALVVLLLWIVFALWLTLG